MTRTENRYCGIEVLFVFSQHLSFCFPLLTVRYHVMLQEWGMSALHVAQFQLGMECFVLGATVHSSLFLPPLLMDLLICGKEAYPAEIH